MVDGQIDEQPGYFPILCKCLSDYVAVFIEDSRVFGSADENAQTIVIHGKTFLSSMNIKVPVTLKDRWLNFANGVRDLFN